MPLIRIEARSSGILLPDNDMVGRHRQAVLAATLMRGCHRESFRVGDSLPLRARASISLSVDSEMPEGIMLYACKAWRDVLLWQNQKARMSGLLDRGRARGSVWEDAQ